MYVDTRRYIHSESEGRQIHNVPANMDRVPANMVRDPTRFGYASMRARDHQEKIETNENIQATEKRQKTLFLSSYLEEFGNSVQCASNKEVNELLGFKDHYTANDVLLESIGKNVLEISKNKDKCDRLRIRASRALAGRDNDTYLQSGVAVLWAADSTTNINDTVDNSQPLFPTSSNISLHMRTVQISEQETKEKIKRKGLLRFYGIPRKFESCLVYSRVTDRVIKIAATAFLNAMLVVSETSKAFLKNRSAAVLIDSSASVLNAIENPDDEQSFKDAAMLYGKTGERDSFVEFQFPGEKQEYEMTVEDQGEKAEEILKQLKSCFLEGVEITAESFISEFKPEGEEEDSEEEDGEEENGEITAESFISELKPEGEEEDSEEVDGDEENGEKKGDEEKTLKSYYMWNFRSLHRQEKAEAEGENDKSFEIPQTSECSPITKLVHFVWLLQHAILSLEGLAGDDSKKNPQKEDTQMWLDFFKSCDGTGKLNGNKIIAEVACRLCIVKYEATQFLKHECDWKSHFKWNSGSSRNLKRPYISMHDKTTPIIKVTHNPVESEHVRDDGVFEEFKIFHSSEEEVSQTKSPSKIEDFPERQRRDAVWSDALRELGITGDKLYCFTRQMAGVVGDDLEGIIRLDDNSMQQSTKMARELRREQIRAETSFQHQVMQVVIAGIVKDSNLSMNFTDSGSNQNGGDGEENNICVVSPTTVEAVRELTSGMSNLPFFAAGREVEKFIKSKSQQTMKMSELFDQLRTILENNANLNMMDTEKGMGDSQTTASLDYLVQPRVAYVIRLKNEAFAGIRTAFDRFRAEFRNFRDEQGAYGMRTPMAYEMIEGTDGELSNAFAAFAGHTMAHSRLFSSSAGSYISASAARANTMEMRMVLHRLVAAAVRYVRSYPRVPVSIDSRMEVNILFNR